MNQAQTLPRSEEGMLDSMTSLRIFFGGGPASRGVDIMES
jgi:hypothetical protein